ncbi:beta-ketoacyl synthase [Solihabitans fulvus]|uniref:Beta-ketoacyl synthase n=1 Tax=Solihabitans fulvus TaxID=1892852 RepID=A0A5B2XQX8_9PSEU|nr:beta-ketoacyl synthase N-terminal-like domain-containing protein [Solihabitans fulvus]KAA2265816.1 beta-ketoacyl synthase [Solihabitans fulvus]
MTIAVTSWSVWLPGLGPAETLGGWSPGPACRPEEAGELLGRKGLLNKEPATRLALCAVHRALGLPPGHRRGRGAPPDPDTAVVASSNLGNVHTTCAVARAVRDQGVRGVSPLDAPNVSSNVIASSVAIWFGFGGPNLMVCSGHPSGLDAIALGGLLLASGRARRVVAVGVEPDDPIAAALCAPGPPLRQAAACVVLEPSGGIVLDRVTEAAGPVFRDEATPTIVIGPGGDGALDLTRRLGHTYGALGVLQVAVGAALLHERGGAARIVCGDPTDGYRTTRLTSARTAS